MANVATQGGTSQSTRGGSPDKQRMAAVVPFIRASMEHRESAGIDVSRALTTADQDLGVFDIPAYGYLRSIFLVVAATGGTGTAAVKHEDAPFSALKNVVLSEPNGAVICQFNSGYDLYLANKWGGYRVNDGADPKSSPTFSDIANAGPGNFAFVLRIPLEINVRDGLGSLPNQNAAATFKLRVTLNNAATGAGLYATQPTGMPTVRVRAWAETWDQPEDNSAGQSNQVNPPAMNTTQFWTPQVFGVAATGLNTFRLTRVGNYIRNLIFVYRNASGSRATADASFPDPLTVLLDSRPVDTVERNNFRHQMYERTGFGGALGTATVANDSPQGLDNGVFVYDFCHEFDGSIGRENRDLWLPTLGSSRVELQGNFGVTGALTVLTNDVAVAGTVFI